MSSGDAANWGPALAALAAGLTLGLLIVLVLRRLHARWVAEEAQWNAMWPTPPDYGERLARIRALQYVAETSAGAPAPRPMPTELTTVYIDGQPEFTRVREMTGAQIRAWFDVSPYRDLWLEVPGKGEDRKVEDGDRIPIWDRARFFTVWPTTARPRAINAGSTP